MPEEIPIPERWKRFYNVALASIDPEQSNVFIRRETFLRLIRELAAAEQHIKRIQANTTDLIAAAENRTHKAEEKLEAVRKLVESKQWSHFQHLYGESCPVCLGALEYFAPPGETHPFDATHREDCWIAQVLSLLNPPAEQPEVEAGK